MSKKTLTTRERAAKFLQPIIDDMQGRGKGLGRGKGRSDDGKKDLARRMSEITGEKISREQVERWLRTDDNKHKPTHPYLGSGLALMEAWEGTATAASQISKFREALTHISEMVCWRTITTTKRQTETKADCKCFSCTAREVLGKTNKKRTTRTK